MAGGLSRYSKNVSPGDVEKAKQDLKIATEKQAQAEQRRKELCECLSPGRGVATPEEMQVLKELWDWTRKIKVAEHSIAKAEHGTPGIVGARDAYQWLSSVDHDVNALLRLCPEVVVGRRIAVTSIDNGTLHLTAEERSAGWSASEDRKVFRAKPDGSYEYRDDWQVAISPRLSSAHGLPNETHDECCAGFDEWYIFDADVPRADFEVFVNWGGFGLYDPTSKWLIERFWTQMADLNPESFVADGTVFTFASRNRDLFGSVIDAFSLDLRPA